MARWTGAILALRSQGASGLTSWQYVVPILLDARHDYYLKYKHSKVKWDWIKDIPPVLHWKKCKSNEDCYYRCISTKTATSLLDTRWHSCVGVKHWLSQHWQVGDAQEHEMQVSFFFFKILSSVWIDEGYVCMSVFHIPLTFFPKYFLSYVFSGCYLKPQWLQTARVNQFCPVGVCHLCSIHVEQLSWARRSPWDSSVHGWRRSQLWASRTVGCRPWVLSR